MKKILSKIAIAISLSGYTQSQNVGINTTGATPDASAMLDIVSADKGLLVPRLSLSATNVAAPVTSPATSLLVYNDATAGSGATAVTPGYYYWNGSEWERLMIAANVSTIINDSLVTNVYPQINNNTTNISNLSTAVTNNTTNISNNATNISNNTSNISTNTTNISNNTTAITNHTTNITSNTNNITSLTNTVNTHIANDLDTVIGNEYNTNFTESNGDITITDGGGSLTVSITNTIANQINDSLVTNVYPLINTNITNINNLTTQVSTNTTNISNNTTDITNLGNDITNIQNTVNTHLANDLDTVIGNEWTIVGNAGTTPGANFVGTTDNAGLQFQTNATERFNITSDGALLYNSTTGSTPTSGAGTRMMWIPEKGAFRAGSVSGTEWDNGNIGNYSFATGQNNIAGDRSIVGGIGNTATSNSLVMGSNNFAGAGSLVAGQNNFHSNVNGLNVGTNNNHQGGSAWVIGQNNSTYNRGFYAGINNIFTAGNNSGSVYVIGNNNLGTSANVQGLIMIGSRNRMPSSNGTESVLIGTRCTAAHNNATVIGNAGSVLPNVSSWGTQTLTMSHIGGTRIYSSTTNGVELAPGSTIWSSISDSTEKTNISLLDYKQVLEKLDDVPIKKWSYITQTPEGQDTAGLDKEQIYTEPIYHIGPMAQDFYQAYGLDISETRITALDLAGVSLAGVKALKEENEELRKELEELKALVYELKK